MHDIRNCSRRPVLFLSSTCCCSPLLALVHVFQTQSKGQDCKTDAKWWKRVKFLEECWIVQEIQIPSFAFPFSASLTRIIASSFSGWPSCFARSISWGFSFFRYDLTSLQAILFSGASIISPLMDSIVKLGEKFPSASNENSIRRLWHQLRFSSVSSLCFLAQRITHGYIVIS